jgi:hypothetical protein
VRIAEVGFLVILLGGAWMAAASVRNFKAGTLRVVGGLGLAAGAVLVIIAIHWGHFG